MAMKGRSTIRHGGTITGIGGKQSKSIPVWTFEAKPDTTIARLERAYLTGIESVDRTEARNKSSAASGKYSEQGVRDDVMRYALNDVVPDLHRARTTIKKAKAEVAERRAKIKIEAPDKLDIAAAIRREGMRVHLRSLTPEAQSKYFADYGDKLPAEVAMAIMESPAEYSGVPNSRRDLIMASSIDAHHSAENAELAAIEEAIAVAESSVEAGREEVRIETGNEVVRVIPIGGGGAKVATPEELETGIFYKDFDEYKAARTA